MKKFIIFLFLFVLLFSLFCYGQASYNTPNEKEYASLKEIVEAIKEIINEYKQGKRAYFLENNAQLFASKDDALFNNLKNNPELFTVLENNPELFNIIDQNPQLFVNILLDEQKLQEFIFSPFTFWKDHEWGYGDGRASININNESLFNSTSQREENYTVQLWKEWGIMK
ncbi:hypothetical protein BFL38_12725 [Brachyspira hampsonii]|uniref:Uncharacterized protein n=1 Tax=Brachyspira hampsonii TaxID=1287055 RepID=A0A1E5NG73_9SPIR|nr:hypothetical protein [Brachyspira hampsonii]OEJ15169.1 hypothetical protein BFL38_12725 [Brachyspira hampsonii]